MIFGCDESMAYPIRSPPISDSSHNTSSCHADNGLQSELDTKQLVRFLIAGQQEQPQLKQLGQAASS